MASRTRKVSVRTLAIHHTLLQDRIPRLGHLSAINEGKRSCEAGIENATVGEKGAAAELHQDPGLHLGRQKLDEPGATAHHARPAHRHAVVLAPGQSPLHRRHLQFDEDHDLFHTLRHAGMESATVGATVTHDHGHYHDRDLHQGFRRLMAEIATSRARSRLHHAADSVV
jgi:hypothetical protein